jgi:GNAT superfamily N-acetyltransferase
MALATWWRGDTLPHLETLPGLTVRVGTDVAQIVTLTSLESAEVQARLDAGHHIYIASLDAEPVSYGWVATLSASIGELPLEFALPTSDRYLWDFVTLPEWRGRGIYPRLLQEIIHQEGPAAQRFWIIYAPENGASGAGIGKAGFEQVSELSFLREQGIATVALAPTDRAQVGTALLGVDLFEAVQGGQIVSPCWRCVIAHRSSVTDAAPCWPHHDSSTSHACSCVVAKTHQAAPASACH